jgi:hypothetical protein
LSGSDVDIGISAYILKRSNVDNRVVVEIKHSNEGGYMIIVTEYLTPAGRAAFALAWRAAVAHLDAVRGGT